MNNEDNSVNNIEHSFVHALHCFQCEESWLQKGNQMSCITCQSEFVEILTTGRRSSFDGPIHNRLKRRNVDPIQEHARQVNVLPSTSQTSRIQPVQQTVAIEASTVTNNDMNVRPNYIFPSIEAFRPLQLSNRLVVHENSNVSNNVSTQPNEVQTRPISNAADLQTQSVTIQPRANHQVSSTSFRPPSNITGNQLNISAQVNGNINLSNQSSRLPTSAFNDYTQKNLRLFTRADMNKIPRVYIKDLSENNSECAICCEDFKRNYVIRQLQCNHVFHQKCLLPWLVKNGTCPTCRFDLIEAKNKANESVHVQ